MAEYDVLAHTLRLFARLCPEVSLRQRQPSTDTNRELSPEAEVAPRKTGTVGVLEAKRRWR